MTPTELLKRAMRREKNLVVLLDKAHKRHRNPEGCETCRTLSLYTRGIYGEKGWI